jgi:hypothetical protein
MGIRVRTDDGYLGKTDESQVGRELRPPAIATTTATVTTYFRYNHDIETLRQVSDVMVLRFY